MNMDTYIQVEEETDVQMDVESFIKEGHDVLNDYFNYLKQTTSFPYSRHDDWRSLKGHGMFCPGSLGALERACRSYRFGAELDLEDFEAKVREAKEYMGTLWSALESDEW